MTNKTKQNQVKENTLELARLSNQFNHNTCSNGDGTKKMFKCIESYINPLLQLDQSPFDSKDDKSSNKQKEDEKKRQKICGSLSQPVLLSSTTNSFGNKDDRRGEKKLNKYSSFVKACVDFFFRSTATSSTIEEQYEQ